MNESREANLFEVRTERGVGRFRLANRDWTSRDNRTGGFVAFEIKRRIESYMKYPSMDPMSQNSVY